MSIDSVTSNNGSSMSNYVPTVNGGMSASGFVNAVGSAASDITSGLVSSMDPFSSQLLNYQLIMKQVEMQRDLQVTNMVSNVEKMKHETQMAPVRNIRVG